MDGFSFRFASELVLVTSSLEKPNTYLESVIENKMNTAINYNCLYMIVMYIMIILVISDEPLWWTPF